MRTLAAIMFTDIAGYTALMQRDEEEALLVRHTHRKYFKEVTQKHEGKILQYYGDGTLSMFNSVHQAIQCGVELQKAFRHPKKIPVRIGIHLGEIIYDKEDIIGDAVNIASRIESLATIGSVFISEKVVEEIQNNKEFKVQLLGAFQFKNVFQPIKVFAVIDEALHIPQPHELCGKLESQDKIYDLPSYPNVFIGRLHHINKLHALLQQDSIRLITLLGPGGMGKTRLSVKIGELSADSFKHGVCFVPLDIVTEHEQVPLYIGHRLGLKESFGLSWTDEIIRFLAKKNLLLILDNLEQILGSATEIARILDKCPQVKILVTSREILGLSHEIEYPLDSLNRPNPKLFPRPEDLVKFDAIDLFVQKAKASVPSFQLTEDNAEAVVQICQELDGLPLPLELAAARLKLFSPELILQKLKTNTNLLKTKSRDVVHRHQTIRNTVKWSYDLLDAEEQQLFQQLSLFRGGFTPTSLEAVCPEQDSLDVIESFINKSLIVKGKEIHYVPRFQMLKLIRDYGLEQLQDNPKSTTYYHHFSQYFIAFVKEGSSKLRGSGQVKWIALFEAEYENLMTALEWLAENQVEKAGELAVSFWRFHLIRGILREGLEMLEKLLPLPMAADTIKARLLEGAGVLSQNLGHYARAKDYFKRCLDVWKEQKDKVEIIKALNNLGWAEWRIGNYDRTISYAENVLDITTEINDEQGKAKALNNMAWICFHRGWFEKAAGLQHEVLQIHKRASNKRGIAFANANLGWICLRMGKLAEAEQMIKDGIRLFKELQDQQLSAFSRVIRAEWFFEKNELETAKALLQDHCSPSFEKIGDIYGLALSQECLGRIYLLDKNDEAAERHLNKAMDLFRNSNDKFGEASTSLWLGKLHLAREHPGIASEKLNRSLSLAAEMGANELLMNAHLEMGILAAQQQKYELGATHMGMADHHAEIIGTYQYQKFLSKAQSHLLAIRKHIEPSQIALLSYQQVQEPHLATPVKQAYLQDRIQKLLTAPRGTAAVGHSENSADQAYKLRKETEDPFARQVRLIIEEHLHDYNFSLKDLCRELGMSHSQLHRKLSAANGQSITKFIRSIRLAKAKDLLQDPNLTIAAVAYDSGFKDPDYFYRVFKKEFGITPKEFRNSNHRK